VKNEARLFLGLTVFLAVIGTVYWLTSYEDTGSVMLAAGALMGVVAGASIWFRARNTPVRLEDRDDATIEDGAGAVDVFPTQSIWPFAVGLSGAVCASGFAFGAWLVAIGLGAFILAVIGYVLEARNTTLPEERSEARP
jgi:hypothetical protein